MNKHVPVDLTTKDGTWQYRNFLDLTEEEIGDIESIHFHYTRDWKEYGEDLPVKELDKVTPKWIQDIYIK
jgi:hypothetical protein